VLFGREPLSTEDIDPLFLEATVALSCEAERRLFKLRSALLRMWMLIFWR
jgi:hypothetical protein